MPTIKDLAGQKFGRLTAIARAGTSKHGKVTWKCHCDCGKELNVISGNLISGMSKSCGCLNLERLLEVPVDLRGCRFDRLLVVERVLQERGSATYGIWDCQCDCGNHIKVLTRDLKAGKSKSCGCLRKEMATTHGKSRSSTYRIWAGMLQRCINQSNTGYVDYGGRGIMVCDAWKDSFEKFYEDMGPRPSPKHSIDRIDVNGNYSKDNCRWATQTEQRRNMRNTLKVNTGEETIPAIVLWGREMDKKVTRPTFYRRLRAGWDWEKALTTTTTGRNTDV
jgi:hypothetical protein